MREVRRKLRGRRVGRRRLSRAMVLHRCRMVDPEVWASTDDAGWLEVIDQARISRIYSRYSW